jgi:hypothetical protein
MPPPPGQSLHLWSNFPSNLEVTTIELYVRLRRGEAQPVKTEDPFDRRKVS